MANLQLTLAAQGGFVNRTPPPDSRPSLSCRMVGHTIRGPTVVRPSRPAPQAGETPAPQTRHVQLIPRQPARRSGTMQYRLLGRSGLRVSEASLGTMTFGEDLGWGAPKDESLAMYNAFREAGGNFIDTANIYTNGTSETFLGRVHERTPRQPRAGHQVYELGPHQRPERQRKPSQEHVSGGRSQSATAANRLYRPLLDAHLGPDDAGRRGDAGLRRPGAARQGFVRRRLRRAGVVDRPGQHAGLPAGMVAVCRIADRVQPDRAHGRAGTAAGRQGPGTGRDRLVAAGQRAVDGQVSRRQRRRKAA